MSSTAVLLFERLTGHNPFGPADDPRRAYRVTRAEMGASVQHFLCMPESLRGVLVRAMAAFPEERYPSVAALQIALRRIADPAVAPDQPE